MNIYKWSPNADIEEKLGDISIKVRSYKEPRLEECRQILREKLKSISDDMQTVLNLDPENKAASSRLNFIGHIINSFPGGWKLSKEDVETEQEVGAGNL